MATTFQNFLNTFNSKLETSVQQHLKNVYACLAMSMVVAAVGAYVDMFTNVFANSFLPTIGAIGFLLTLTYTSDNGKNLQLRIGFLMGFSFCSGLGLGPLLSQVAVINPSIIPTAFIATSVIFVAFSISSLFAKRGSYLFIGGAISSALLILFFTSIINIFIRSQFLFQTHLYLGLALMCAFVLYDTQLIIEKRRLGDKDFVAHSVDLFIDFIGIFRRILIILSQKENDKTEKKR